MTLIPLVIAGGQEQPATTLPDAWMVKKPLTMQLVERSPFMKRLSKKWRKIDVIVGFIGY